MFDDVWQFLNDQGPMISSVAAIVAIVAGIWKFVALFAKNSRAKNSRESRPVKTAVKADRGGIAAGRDVNIDKHDVQ